MNRKILIPIFLIIISIILIFLLFFVFNNLIIKNLISSGKITEYGEKIYNTYFFFSIFFLCIFIIIGIILLIFHKKINNYFLIILPFFIFFISLIVYSFFGIQGKLLRDDSIYIYSGQQFSSGVMPYNSIFDHKGPLTPIICGISSWFSNLTNNYSVFFIRFTFLIISSLTVVMVYFLSKKLFSSNIFGFLSSMIFLNFYGFSIHALSGPRAKTPMVLFITSSIYFLYPKSIYYQAF